MCDSRTVAAEDWAWEDFGARVAEARRAAGLTQDDLAYRINIDRTAVSKIEGGRRGVDSRELVRIARAVGRPVGYFLDADLPAVISRRAERADHRVHLQSDAVLEDFARDVRVLLELRALRTETIPPPNEFQVGDSSAVEAAALRTRQLLGLTASEPVVELQEIASTLGLIAYLVDLGDQGADGSYIRVDDVGVAVVNAYQDQGRRRFTLAHELGHHLLGDAYSIDWGAASGEHELAIDRFAAALLLPEVGIREAWPMYLKDGGQRQAAIRVGVRYRSSWTAVLRRLLDLQLITRRDWRTLEAQSPTKADYVEARTQVPIEHGRTKLPTVFTASVLRAYRTHLISGARAVEMLRGEFAAPDLPSRDEIPLEALSDEMR